MTELIKIEKEKCVGCGACVQQFPDVFELEDMRAKIKKQPDKIKEEHISICSFGAIKKEKE